MVLLDSSAIIEIIKGTPKGQEILAKVKEGVFVSPFSIYEVFLGLKQNENILLEKLLNTTQLINFDMASALISVQIMKKLTNKGEKISVVDVFIASIAIANNLTLVTLDHDFKKIENLKSIIF